MTKDTTRLVLVVEDDVSVRRPLVKFLEMHGFAVLTAETSDEGVELFALGSDHLRGDPLVHNCPLRFARDPELVGVSEIDGLPRFE